MWKFTLFTIVVMMEWNLPASEGQNIFFPRRFVFRQNPQIVHKIVHDKRQVKPNKVTRDNLFGFLNLKNYVRFHLWSRDNRELAHEIKVNDMESLMTSSFNKKRLTKFIIHGYQDNANEVSVGDWIIFMKDAYLNLADVNVIAVDYSFFATTPFYLTAVHELAAEKLKDLIEFLVANYGVDLDSIHLIGWSWGAQIAGLTGHALKGQLGRITGLDPAGPTFKFVDNEFRLDKTDAKFVDVIHTNSGTRVLWGAHFGLRNALAHVDIYPNGGERQVGCPAEHTFNVESLLCNHGRANRLFIESISSPLAFPMCPCDDFDKFVKGGCPCRQENFVYLGEHMSPKTRGVFQLITRSQYPYGHGPKMSVSLPSIGNDDDDDKGNQIFVENSNESKSVRNSRQEEEKEEKKLSKKMDVATVDYKNSTAKVQFRNRYRAGRGEYPNDDILKLSLFAFKNMCPDCRI